MKKRKTLVLNTPKNPYLNQATQKKYLPKFSYQKNHKIENLKAPPPPKILQSSLSLEIQSTPPPPGKFLKCTALSFILACNLINFRVIIIF